MATLALEACRHLDDEHFSVYADLVRISLNEAARAALENLMGHYEYQSDFVKKHVGIGRAQGRAEGLAEGRAEGRAQDIVAVLEARGLSIGDDARARILGCTDLPVLDGWIRKAVKVASVDELFRD